MTVPAEMQDVEPIADAPDQLVRGRDADPKHDLARAGRKHLDDGFTFGVGVQ